MIVAIDTNCILPGKVGGIENYTVGLIEALQGRGSPLDRLVLLTRPENHDRFAALADARTRAVLVDRPTGTWAALGATGAEGARAAMAEHQRRKTDAIAAAGADVVHCPGNTINPLGLPAPVVLNLHDLQHRHYPQYFTAEELAERETWWTASARRADALLAASDYVRDDLHTQLGIAPTQVFVAPDPVEAAFARTPTASELAEVRTRFALPASFFLYPAAAWPHKNHARLFRAIGSVPGAELILTGGGHDALPAAPGVRSLGRVATADLVALYHLATAVVFPSQHESWSIPLAEAMTCGCPVAAAAVTSLPEQVGDAGLLFPADDHAAMADAIRRLSTDASLRRTLAERGRAQVRQWTPQRFLQTVLAAYGHACRGYRFRKAA